MATIFNWCAFGMYLLILQPESCNLFIFLLETNIHYLFSDRKHIEFRTDDIKSSLIHFSDSFQLLEILCSHNQVFFILVSINESGSGDQWFNECELFCIHNLFPSLPDHLISIFYSQKLNRTASPLLGSRATLLRFSLAFVHLLNFNAIFVICRKFIIIDWQLSNQNGNEGPMHTPHVFPFFKRMNPFSPHVVSQEFLIVQACSLEPTKKTAWLSLVSQLSNIPEAYRCQLVASTRTAIGLFWITIYIYEQPVICVTPYIL